MHDTLEKRILFYADSGHRLLPGQLPSALHRQYSRNVLRQLTPPQVEKDWYLAFRLANSADTAIGVYLFPGFYLRSSTCTATTTAAAR